MSKSLNSIICSQSYLRGFPVRGQNGYGGEQDGSYPILHVFTVDSREEAKKIEIPNCLSLHWGRYTALLGWELSVGYWSSENLSTRDVDLIEKIWRL